jgi:hypothetical protein
MLNALEIRRCFRTIRANRLTLRGLGREVMTSYWRDAVHIYSIMLISQNAPRCSEETTTCSAKPTHRYRYNCYNRHGILVGASVVMRCAVFFTLKHLL